VVLFVVYHVAKDEVDSDREREIPQDNRGNIFSFSLECLIY